MFKRVLVSCVKTATHFVPCFFFFLSVFFVVVLFFMASCLLNRSFAALGISCSLSLSFFSKGLLCKKKCQDKWT